MKLSLGLALSAVVAVSAATATKPATWVEPSVGNPTYLEDGSIRGAQNGMTQTTGAQGQTCSGEHKFIRADKLVNADGKFEVHDQMFHPNIEWVPVKHDKWTFDGTQLAHPHPLGFRQAAFSGKTPICLKLPASSAQHKIEIMIEYMSNTKICIQDIRQTMMNNDISLVRSCNNKGKLNACFSAMSGKSAAAEPEDVKATLDAAKAKGVVDPKVPVNAPTQTAEFAVAIGCFGAGCRDDVASSVLFYRIRQSTQSWTDKKQIDSMTAYAHSGLDMWCMNLGTTNRNLINFKKSGLASDDSINTVPQKYPSDLWTIPQYKNLDNGANEAFPVDTDSSSAATIMASVVSVALPLIAMLL